MRALSNISLSGMQAAQTALQASAHNIANLGTSDFHRVEVQQRATAGGGVSTQTTRAELPGEALAADLVAQLQARNAFLANLKVFKTASALSGSLLDQKA